MNAKVLTYINSNYFRSFKMKHEKGFVGVVLLIFGVLFASAVLASATNLITIPWLKFDRQVETERGIIDKTYNAENALSEYHWFKDRYEAIKATEAKVDISAEAIKDFHNVYGKDPVKWTFEDKNEYSRLISIKNGLKGQYEDLVAEYNGRAKSVDRAIFKDELPTFFSLKAY